jgi:hypothetical protein
MGIFAATPAISLGESGIVRCLLLVATAADLVRRATMGA